MGQYLKHPGNNGERVCGWNKIIEPGGGGRGAGGRGWAGGAGGAGGAVGLKKTCLIFVLDTKKLGLMCEAFGTS